MTMMESLRNALERSEPESVLVFFGVSIVTGLLFSIVFCIFIYNFVGMLLHR